MSESTRVYYGAMVTRVVRASLSPPRRLLASNRWRTFKTTPDKHVWEQALQPVADLIDDGFDITSVHVEWGRSKPHGVMQETRYLCWCVDECVLTESYGTGKKGFTEFTLTKDGEHE